MLMSQRSTTDHVLARSLLGKEPEEAQAARRAAESVRAAPVLAAARGSPKEVVPAE